MIVHPFTAATPVVADALGSPLGLADAVRLQQEFLRWWHPALECLVATQKLFRRFDDDDLTALYLAAWRFALEQLDTQHKPATEDRILAFITQLDAARFEGANVARYAEVTGIPRETARRKLDKASAMGLLDRVDDARYRLRAFSADILPMFENCLGLARALLACLGRTPAHEGADLPAPAWIALMHAYIVLVLGFWSARRRMTRVSSAISVQSVIELLTVLKSYRRLAIEGATSKVDLATFLSAAPKIRKSPYFVSQIAFVSGLPLNQVRRMCRYLETQGKLEFLGPDAIRPLPLVENVPADLQQAFFSEEVRLGGLRFVGVAMRCLLAPRPEVVGHA